MNPTDMSEASLERLIVESLTGRREPAAGVLAGEPGLARATGYLDEQFYVQGDPKDYDREHALDAAKLLAFLETTQPKTFAALGLAADGPMRAKFLHRVQGEIAKRGIIDVLRKGLKHGPDQVDMYFGAPTPGNEKALERFRQNIFSVTRQLRYSKDETRLALDLAIFINGLPAITFELKNSLTKQTYDDAVMQYKRDRDPRELLFQFGRCIVHLAADDQQVWMCTELKGKTSWFLPFNKGCKDGAGNPPNPDGLATDYLWKEVLARENLADIIENYAQIVEEEDSNGRKRKKQIFPRYHQLDVTRKLLKHAQEHGAGQRYLIQHSAGSGKSNSIAWFVHQAVELKKDGNPVFDTLVVVTDRRVLDKQIRENIKQFTHVSAVVGAVTEGSKQLREFIEAGKKIIITTVQKFPFILDEIGSEHSDRRFGIVIDEAHSSQGGRTMAKMHMALSKSEDEDEETTEDIINRIIESRRLLPNAGYFAFTATPKNKTLEMFGIPQKDGSFRPFHSYTMKQAIQEGFILDVLENYTPVNSWYRLVKTVEPDPTFDIKKAQKKLRRYVESHDHAIRRKAEIMVDHFHEEVAGRNKIGGKAKAMVVCSGIKRAMQYKVAFDAYLKARKSPYKAIVAFSGEHEFRGDKLNEAKMNGFPSARIEDTFRNDDLHRFLIVADKFQTGYDEPLLHTMYVDKILAGGKAVQTLSRLNRAHPRKHDTFILDFQNEGAVIQKAFEPYYRTTILSESTDPNKLNDLQADLDAHQVYSASEVNGFVELYLAGADREKLDPILDGCVAAYMADLDDDKKIDFKGKAKAFLRTYNFLATVMPSSSPTWEKLSVFLNFLVPKLPAPLDDDLTKGLLETIDMDSYRAEVMARTSISLPDEDGSVAPIPAVGGGRKPEPELDYLSNIIRQFNELWGDIPWQDKDKARRIIAEELPAKVAADKAYRNAQKNSDKNAARIEHDRALKDAILAFLADQTEIFKQYQDNDSFRKWLSDTIFTSTYQAGETKPAA
jgi:type I restriction enzyme, R subunit